jgi:hypothetical protein
MKYDRFFNLHIPKTGGTHFSENMLSSVESILNNNKIQTNKDNDLPEYLIPTRHWCWFKPFITDNTYIFSILRDPAKRIVSQFAWQAKSAILYTNTKKTEKDINKENFYLWLESSDNLYKNVQSKNLVYYDEDYNSYIAETNTRWLLNEPPKKDHFMFKEKFKNYEINKKDLINNINRINFLVKSEDLFILGNQQKIINKILLDLNIEHRNFFINEKSQEYINPISKKLFNEFSKKEIDWLYNYQDIDTEIYFSNVYTKY